jgi:mono/diheme cytochrome c family protein
MRNPNGRGSGLILASLLIATACGAAGLDDDAKPRVGPDTPGRSIVKAAGIEKVETLEQNWSDAEARWFYETPQGSEFFPYSWFLVLEQAGNQRLFRSASNMRRLGFIPRHKDSAGNPDGLPVGFTKDRHDDHGRISLGLTCAACHTNEIHHERVAYVIDGAPTMGDLASLQRELVAALRATIDDEGKLQRFARQLGRADIRDQSALVEEMREVLAEREGFNGRNLPGEGDVAFGHARYDAFGAITNEVNVRFLGIEANRRKADAPVSFPFLWDTPQHDRVQWNGVAENSIVTTPIVKEAVKDLIGTVHTGSLGRNIGEVYGVYGRVVVDDDDHKVFYPTTVNRGHLIEMEAELRNLWSPQWPEGFPKIDEKRAKAGQVHYAKHCATCHEQDFDRQADDRKIVAKMVDVGTDARMAQNFSSNRVKTGPLEGRHRGMPIGSDFFGSEAHAGDILSHVVKRSLFNIQIKGSREAVVGDGAPPELDQNKDAIQALEKFDTDFSPLLDLHFPKPEAGGRGESLPRENALRPGVARGDANRDEAPALDSETVARSAALYKARPLNGIWATAPFLHNGSVRTLLDLLRPAAQREASFRVGSREFDAAGVGFKNEGPSVLDTRLLGNSNAGHEFGTELSPAQRLELLEYLKTL